MTYTFRLDDWPGARIEADYEYHRAYRGRRVDGVPMEPDEAEHVEVQRMRLCTEGGCVSYWDKGVAEDTAEVILAEIRAEMKMAQGF